jgi:hypothetical protein
MVAEMSHLHSAAKAMRVTGTVLLCAVPLLAGCSDMLSAGANPDVTTPRATPSTAVTTAAPIVIPATTPSPIASPSTAVTTVAQTLYSSASLSVTLTTMTITGDQVTADVSYQNVGSAALALYCSSASDPAIDTLTTADGMVIAASHTYCSDNPTATLDLLPGGTHSSYAVFDGVQASSGPFTLTWQGNTGISGAVSGISLG